MELTVLSQLMYTSLTLTLLIENAFSESRQQILQTLLSDPNYDASVPPDFEKEHPTNVTVQLTIGNMYSISETSMEFSIDCILRQTWRDERLSYEDKNSSSIKLELDSKQLGSVWQPDLYFKNEKRASIHTITNSNKLMHIYKNGTIVYSMRIALTLTCTMLLQFFPFDSQTCPVLIQSFGYTDKNIDIAWKSSEAFEYPDIEMPQFELAEQVKLSEYSETFETGTFTVLKAELQIDRKTGYYALQVIIPSILLVVLSWVSFWVDPKAVPARISLGVTCVLTMTTQSSGIRQTLPPVSYVKAIDVWMLVCLLFVFGALLEFAFVNVQTRRTDEYKSNKTTAVDSENQDETRNIEGGTDIRMKTMFSNDNPQKGEAQKSKIDFAILAQRADQVSRIAFPGVFILFMFVFYCVCLLAPDPKVEE